MRTMNGPIVVLLSGGLDSATALAMAVHARHVSQMHEVRPLHVQYGQRHAREHASAVALCTHYNLPLHEMRVSSGGGIRSALTSQDVDVPSGRTVHEMVTGAAPATYVPARNTFLIGLAASFAESIDAREVHVGFNAIDYSGYPDCRPEFVASMNTTLLLGTKAGVRVVAPLVDMPKAEIVRIADALKLPFNLTWSCYRGGDAPCGTCDSCIIRAAAFAEAGVADAVAA